VFNPSTGTLVPGDIETDTNPFRYCGEYFDKETGDIYLRARFYNPANSRFNSQDPAMSGLNWYVYCSNNPVMLIDPWGLKSVIFYGKDATQKEIDARKAYYEEKYETDCDTIEVGSAKDLVNEWNNLFNKWEKEGTPIDAIEINAHGSITGDVGKDEGGTAYSTGYIYFTAEDNSDRLYARTIDGMSNADDRSTGYLRSITAKEMNVNACNSANKDTYNVVFGFMQKVNYTDKMTGWDGGTVWNPNIGDHDRGGGKDNNPIEFLRRQPTFYWYVEKDKYGMPTRWREGRRTFGAN